MSWACQCSSTSRSSAGKFGWAGTSVSAGAWVGGHRLVLAAALRCCVAAARTTRPLPCGRTAVPPRLPPASRRFRHRARDRSSAGCDGPDPPGSSRARRGPFFRGLPGDSRIIALGASSVSAAPVFRASTAATGIAAAPVCRSAASLHAPAPAVPATRKAGTVGRCGQPVVDPGQQPGPQRLAARPS